jgi:hypothetical protein
MPNKNNPLYQQLEDKRFLHGISYSLSAAHGLKKLTASELAHLNQLLTDSEENDPWRFETKTIHFPGGHAEINVHNNPINKAREIAGTSQEMAGNGKILEAAVYLYSELVLNHLFHDANRRTAVLATIWLLEHANVSIDPHQLLKIPLGNLRNPQDLQQLRKSMAALIGPN